MKSSINIDPNCSMNIKVVLNQLRSSTLTSKMDISAYLNTLEEPEQDTEAMEVDSSALSPQTHHPQTFSESSENSQSPSSQSSRIYTHTLPPMESQQVPLGQEQTASNTLPSIKLLFRNISSSPPLENGNMDYCSQIGMLKVQHIARLNCRPPPRIHHSRCTEGIVRNFNDYQPQPLPVVEQTSTRLSRRHSHHSPLSPRNPHHRIFRRGSHSQSLWSVPIRHAAGGSHPYRQPTLAAQDPDTHYDASSPPVSKPTAHSNKPYTAEMCDWIRYHRVDRGLTFKQDMLPLFFEQFPERFEPNATEQILSSRYYRDNDRPWLDENGNWGVDQKGALKTVKTKVRDATTAEGKELDFPRSLVDKWPARLLCERYRHWKSPILEEDRDRARQILAGQDPNDLHGSKSYPSL